MGELLAQGPEEDTRQAVLDLDTGGRHHLEPSQVDQICEAFADVVDAKSHFTFRHSHGVADAAFGIAQAMGLLLSARNWCAGRLYCMTSASLSISNTILDKRTELSASEWKTVHKHPRITRLILQRVRSVPGDGDDRGRASREAGRIGLSRSATARDLSIESRIIAVADVYGALSEDRPYRAGIRLEETLAIMSKFAPYQLDGDCLTR